MYEETQINKDATYNQAAYLMLRLHELMKRVDICNTNPLYKSIEFGLYNYEIVFNDLKSVLFLISSKLSLEELKVAVMLRDLIYNYFSLYPIWEVTHNVSIGDNKNFKKLNKENWNKINELLSMFRLELESLMEAHKIGNPSKEDPRRAILN